MTILFYILISYICRISKCWGHQQSWSTLKQQFTTDSWTCTLRKNFVPKIHRPVRVLFRILINVLRVDSWNSVTHLSVKKCRFRRNKLNLIIWYFSIRACCVTLKIRKGIIYCNYRIIFLCIVSTIHGQYPWQGRHSSFRAGMEAAEIFETPSQIQHYRNTYRHLNGFLLWAFLFSFMEDAQIRLLQLELFRSGAL